MRQYDIGHRVLVIPFNKAGRVATVSGNPSGDTLYGIVYDDEERRVRGRKGAMDVYVSEKSLQPLDSGVSFE